MRQFKRSMVGGKNLLRRPTVRRDANCNLVSQCLIRAADVVVVTRLLSSLGGRSIWMPHELQVHLSRKTFIVAPLEFSLAWRVSLSRSSSSARRPIDTRRGARLQRLIRLLHLLRLAWPATRSHSCLTYLFGTSVRLMTFCLGHRGCFTVRQMAPCSSSPSGTRMMHVCSNVVCK